MPSHHQISPKIHKKSLTVSSNKTKSLNPKKISSKNTSLKKYKKNLIHSKFWNFKKMPLKTKSNKHTENQPSNTIQRTTPHLKLLPNLLNLEKPMNKQRMQEMKQNMLTQDSEVSSKILISKLKACLDLRKKEVKRRNNLAESRNHRQDKKKILGVNFTQNLHTFKMLMENKPSSYAKRSTRRMVRTYV